MSGVALVTGCLRGSENTNDGTDNTKRTSDASDPSEFRGGSLQVFLLLYEPADGVPVTPIDDESLNVESVQDAVSTADEWVAENPDEVERFEEESEEETLRIPSAAVSFGEGDEEDYREVKEVLESLPDGDYEGRDVGVPSDAPLVESENVYALFLSELV